MTHQKHRESLSYPSLLPLTYLKIDASAKSIFNFCLCIYTCTHSVNCYCWPSLAVIMLGGCMWELTGEAGERQIAGAAPRSAGLGSFLFKTHLSASLDVASPPQCEWIIRTRAVSRRAAAVLTHSSSRKFRRSSSRMCAARVHIKMWVAT